MGQSVTVNFKLDKEVKNSMEQACKDMGLSMSSAFTIFAKKVSRERRIPFEITADAVRLESAKAIVEDLKRAEERAEKEGWITEEEMKDIMGI